MNNSRKEILGFLNVFYTEYSPYSACKCSIEESSLQWFVLKPDSYVYRACEFQIFVHNCTVYLTICSRIILYAFYSEQSKFS